MTLEQHLRLFFDDSRTPVDNLLEEWKSYSLQITDADFVVHDPVQRGKITSMYISVNLENRCKLHFHSSAIAHCIINAEEVTLSPMERIIQSELRKLKQKILDKENIITTTFVSINLLVHYCRIFNPNNYDHYKRDVVKFIINETLHPKHVNELLEQKDRKNTLVAKKKFAIELFEDRDISKPMIENLQKATRTTAQLLILEQENKTIDEILANNKTLKFEMSIYKTKLDEIIEKLIKDYESQIKLDIFDDFYRLYEFLNNALEKIAKNLNISKNFKKMKTGDFNHQLAKLDKRKSEIDCIDRDYINRVYKNESFKLYVPERFGGKFSVTVQRLLNMLLSTNTQSGESPEFFFTVEEYMTLCNLKDRKETIKHIKKDLEILFESNYWWKEVRSEGKIRIIESWIIKNGTVRIKLAPTFWGIFKNYAIGLISTRSLAINISRNPNCQHFSFKITQHKYMNSGKQNENIISVRTLLEGSEIPTYEEVMDGNKHVTERIIEPFERDLNALSDDFSWEYCHRNGDILTDEELRDFSYNVFVDLNILTNWKDFPYQDERLNRKIELSEKANSKTKASKKK